MNPRTLLIVLLSLPLGSVLLLRAQESEVSPHEKPNDSPHGDLAMDCGECHVPERWAPVDSPPTFRHDSTGFELLNAHQQAACVDCHTTLVFDHVNGEASRAKTFQVTLESRP